MAPNNIITNRKLTDLREHPRQQDNFGDVPEFQIDDLVASLEKEGQIHPIEITSEGIVIDGHQRLRAAKKLGWKELGVVVREDLEAMGVAAIETRMIEANLNRRQLDDLGVARVYKRLRELQPRRTRSASGVIARNLRDRIAAQLGTKSGRTIDRYLRLLEAPKVVQDACTSRKIGKSAVLQVVSLPRDVQERIVNEIQAGGGPKDVIAKHARKAAKKAEGSANEYTRILRQLEGVVAALNRKFAGIGGKGLGNSHSTQVLEKSIAALQRLLTAEKDLKARQKKHLEDTDLQEMENVSAKKARVAG